MDLQPVGEIARLTSRKHDAQTIGMLLPFDPPVVAEELYDHREDPAERVNVASDRPAEVKRSRGLMTTGWRGAVPDSARVVQMVGQQEDPHNFLLMHAMAPNVSGVIGSAICAGILWSFFI